MYPVYLVYLSSVFSDQKLNLKYVSPFTRIVMEHRVTNARKLKLKNMYMNTTEFQVKVKAVKGHKSGRAVSFERSQ